MSKRYVLIFSDGDFSEALRRDLAVALEGRYGGAGVIAVDSNPRAVIVKTTDVCAELLRRECEHIRVGKMHLTTVLSSGSIGKLKSRASSGGAEARHGKVHE